MIIPFLSDKILLIENLTTLIEIESLFLVHNQIRTVENLSTLVNLRVLELGDNRIKVRILVMFSMNLIDCIDFHLENRKSRIVGHA